MIVVMAITGILTGYAIDSAARHLPPRLAARAVEPVPSAPRLRLALMVAGGLGFAVLAAAIDDVTALLLYALVSAFFVLVAVIDLRYRLILNAFTYPAILLALAVHLLRGEVLPVLLGGGMAFAIFYLTARLKPGQLGGGDVKLATLIGLIFGFPQVLWALIVGAGSGGIVTVLLLLSQRYGWQSRIPYAPFLCVGALVALFFNPITLPV